MRRSSYPTSNDIDILFLLEGTFPFVLGGVSSWVNTLITRMPQYRFGAIFIGGRKEEYHGLQYTLPQNLVHLETHYMFPDFEKPKKTPFLRGPDHLYETIEKFHCPFKDLASLNGAEELNTLYELLFSQHALSEEEFWYLPECWRYIVDNYVKRCNDISFIDYFWTIRNMHAPIWRIVNIVKQIPHAKLYHSASTGYAGLLGALLKKDKNKPFILSEHGIYTRERRIDLLKKNWLDQPMVQNLHQEYIHEQWISLFEVMSRVCYGAADPIISLFHNNRERQIMDGAPEEKTLIIPNGVDIAQLKTHKRAEHNLKQPVIALVGRVVKIKDIKTFIRAMATIITHIPLAQGWIIGPQREAPDYVTECIQLVNTLQLNEKVFFKGLQNLKDILQEIDLMVLTSISEGQPLVLLEGFAAGVPAVATDVGDCRELIYGLNEEDKALGEAGRVVNISDPAAFSNAVLELLENPATYEKAAKAGEARVEKYYNLDSVIKRYNAIYEEKLH